MSHVPVDSSPQYTIEQLIVQAMMTATIAKGEESIDAETRMQPGAHPGLWRLCNDTWGFSALGIRPEALIYGVRVQRPSVSVGQLEPVCRKHLIPVAREYYGLTSHEDIGEKIDELAWFFPHLDEGEPSAGRISRCLDEMLERRRVRLVIVPASCIDSEARDSFVLRLPADDVDVPANRTIEELIRKIGREQATPKELGKALGKTIDSPLSKWYDKQPEDIKPHLRQPLESRGRRYEYKIRALGPFLKPYLSDPA